MTSSQPNDRNNGAKEGEGMPGTAATTTTTGTTTTTTTAGVSSNQSSPSSTSSSDDDEGGWFWKEVDHVGFRATLCTCFGSMGGTVHAMYKGHRSIARTTALTAISCSLAATVAFGCERIVAVSASNLAVNKQQQGPIQQRQQSTEPAGSTASAAAKTTTRTVDFAGGWAVRESNWRLATHAVGGGMMGGSILGAMYIGKPLRGIVFVTPIMILIGMSENYLQAIRDKKQLELLQQQQQEQEQQVQLHQQPQEGVVQQPRQ